MKQIYSNQGHTVIEIAIALGLVGLVSLGIFSLTQETLKNIQHSKLATTRDQLATQFRQSAGRMKNLRLSLTKPENEAFLNCVCGKGSGCTSAQSYPLSLYDDALPDKPISTFYDYAGMPCDQNADSCAIRVTVNFVPQCKPVLPSADPTPPATCVGVPVEFFAVSFTVQQNPATLSQGSLFKTIGGSSFTQVSALVAGTGVCN
ncbi:Tfp pilus assembly protein FimT/FimU [Bdellovibrio sp. HCB2-146]|uniref:pilus assembly FimT family protein n=1 Tax=Bdellovibrio sp. HCB2-146 TaxID=3394362 RepID=UPI0039BCAECA